MLLPCLRIVDQKWREGDVLAEKRTKSVSDSSENMEDGKNIFILKIVIMLLVNAN